MRKNVFWLFLIGIVLTLAFNLKSIKILLVKLFHQNLILVNYNSQGKPEGEYLEFIGGKLYLKQQFVDGLREGYAIEYYPNGNIKIKGEFRHGRPHGVECGYFENK